MSSLPINQSPDVLIERFDEITCGIVISFFLYFIPFYVMLQGGESFGMLTVLESLLLSLQRTFESTYLPVIAGAPLLWNLLACYAIVQIVLTFPWLMTVEMLLIAHFRLLVLLPVYVLKIAILFIFQLVYLVWCMITLRELHQNRKFSKNVHPFVLKPSKAADEEV